MEVLSLFIVFIGWVAFSLFEGLEEAYTINYRDSFDKGYDKNLHPLWTGQRLVVGIVFCILLLIILKVWYIVLLVGVGMICSFPFYHEGVYYLRMNQLNGSYPKKWKTNQNSSNAKISIQAYRIRFIFMILGVVAFILSFILFHLSIVSFYVLD